MKITVNRTRNWTDQTKAPPFHPQHTEPVGIQTEKSSPPRTVLEYSGHSKSFCILLSKRPDARGLFPNSERPPRCPRPDKAPKTTASESSIPAVNHSVPPPESTTPIKPHKPQPATQPSPNFGVDPKNPASSGAPVRTRTSNLLIRSQMLYPIELRVHPARKRDED